MKKIFIVLLAIISFCAPLLLRPTSNRVQAQAASEAQFNSEAFTEDAGKFLNTYKQFTFRLAGSKIKDETETLVSSEERAQLYIVNEMTKLGLTAADTERVKAGIQEFGFVSEFNGQYSTSRNIVFDYLGNSESKKKLIIGCNYDSVAFEIASEQVDTSKIVPSESIISSSSSVATVYALASAVKRANLKVNIEFIFFGAGESGNAGSNFFVQGIGDEEKKDIVGMINLDSVVGENLYFYVDEVNNKVSDYLEGASSASGGKITKINTSHLAKMALESPNALGLTYSHIAMSSDNFSFMQRGIVAVNIIAGDYSSGLMIGRNDFKNKANVSYTANDNMEYIGKTFGNVVMDGIGRVGAFIFGALEDAEFLKAFEAGTNQNAWFAAIFGNKNLAMYLTVFALIAFVIIAMLLHYKFTVKAYHANIETEFLSSVIQITEQIEPENSDENVAKIVSKVLAEDIKRDKTIKVKKKDKDEQE